MDWLLSLFLAAGMTLNHQIYDPSSLSSLRRTVDWLQSVLLLIVGSARRGSQLLAVWVIAYASRTLFAWRDHLPLELRISSLASVLLAVHRKNLHVSYPYVDLPLALKISSLASVVLTKHWKNL